MRNYDIISKTCGAGEGCKTEVFIGTTSAFDTKVELGSELVRAVALLDSASEFGKRVGDLKRKGMSAKDGEGKHSVGAAARWCKPSLKWSRA